MPIVTLTDIHVSFGPEVVFSGLNQRFYAKEKVGLIGPNGSGKTTILKLILGEVEAEKGNIVRRKGLTAGYLPQEAAFDGKRSVLEEMHAGLKEVFTLQNKMLSAAEHLSGLCGGDLKSAMEEYDRLSSEFELAGGYEFETRIHTTLAGLGLGEEVYHTKTSALSGGQKSRLGLAKALLAEADLLLLDEPTNHLDLEATVWLEKFLRSYGGAVILISHDRYLLDAVACRIIEIRDRKSVMWKGNYSKYLIDKGKSELSREREYEQRVEMVRKTEDFIARNKDREGMRGTARGRKHRLKRLLEREGDFLERPSREKTIGFRFQKETKKSDIVLRADSVSKSFGELVLFENLSFDVTTGERLGITGPNGCGKSTLIKIALGQMEPTSGSLQAGTNLTFGYLDQHGRELSADKTVLEEAHASCPEQSEEEIRTKLGAFLFRGEEVFKKISQLSGGQQNRLMLCKLVLAEPDVLILDEPTNHLDISSREVLEQALRSYGGTIVFVSHDRFFLDKTAGRLLVMGTDDLGQRKVGEFNFFGGARNIYSQYAESIERRLAEHRLAKEESSKVKRQSDGDLRKKKAKAPNELRRFNKYKTSEIERMIIELEEEIGVIQEGFGQTQIYQQPELLAEHRALHERKREELKTLYRVYESREK